MKPVRPGFVPGDGAIGGGRWFGPLNPPIVDWAGRRVWLVGASSGIGAELARELARRGARLAISARRPDHLQALAAEAAGATVLPLDVTDAAAVAECAAAARRALGGIDLVVWLAGNYVPMRADTFDLQVARDLLAVNYGGVLNGVAALVPMLSAQGAGALALVASVAGYRGLPKALAYGPTKAAMINLAENLYVDLRPRGIGIYLINPGFVATPLTAGNDFSMPGLVTPVQAAQAIIAGFGRGAFEIHFPLRFTLWMKLLRWMPNRLYLALARRMGS